MVLRPVDDDRNAEMILSSFDYITPLENAHILGRWNYYRREREPKWRHGYPPWF